MAHGVSDPPGLRMVYQKHFHDKSKRYPTHLVYPWGIEPLTWHKVYPTHPFYVWGIEPLTRHKGIRTNWSTHGLSEPLSWQKRYPTQLVYAWGIEPHSWHKVYLTHLVYAWGIEPVTCHKGNRRHLVHALGIRTTFIAQGVSNPTGLRMVYQKHFHDKSKRYPSHLIYPWGIEPLTWHKVYPTHPFYVLGIEPLTRHKGIRTNWSTHGLSEPLS